MSDFPLDALPGHYIRRLQQIAVALFLEETAEFGITPVQFAALQAVDHHRQPKRNHHRRAVHRSALGFASIRRPQEGDGEGKPLRGAQIRAHGKNCLFGDYS